MKVTCHKCNYELEIEDNLLIEGNLEFSCPKCQNAVKVDSSEVKKPHDDDKEEPRDPNRTDIISKKDSLELEEDDTIIQPSNPEITVDKIADEISFSKSEKDDLADLLPEPSEISRTFREQSSSDVSMISSSKTQIEETTGQRTEVRPKSREDEPSKTFVPEVSKEASLDEMFERTGKGSPSPSSTGGAPHGVYTTGFFAKENIIANIPLVILLMIFAFYPFLSIKFPSEQRETDKNKAAVEETLKTVYKYYAYDTVDSLMMAGELLLDQLKKFPESNSLKAAVAKLYADLGSILNDRDMQYTSLELCLDTLTEKNEEPDTLRALAIYYLDDPELAARFFNRAANAAAMKGLNFPGAEDYYIAARLDLRIGEVDKAIDHLNNAVSEDPDFIRAYRLMTQIHTMRGEKNMAALMSEKIDSIRTGIEKQIPELKSQKVALAPRPKPTPKETAEPPPIAPKLTPTAAPKRKAVYFRKLDQGKELYAKSKYWRAQKELAESAKAYKKFFPKHTRSKTLSEIYAYLGWTYLKLYKTDAALNTFKASISHNYQNPLSHKGLGRIYEDLGETYLAGKEYELYLKYEPNASDKSEIQKRIEKLK